MYVRYPGGAESAGNGNVFEGGRAVGENRKAKRGVESSSREVRRKRKPSPLPALSDEQQRLVRENIGLVGVHLRTRVPTPSQPMRHREHEDLFQEGCLALARAAARYNPKTDGKFGAYALARIRGGVFAALHERFSLIRIPPHALQKHSQFVTVNAIENTGGITEDKLPAETRRSASPLAEQKTVRHAIRERFERAIRRALAELRTRQWRRRDPTPIMARLADERLLVDASNAQTPLRQIARDFGISSGRASAYEQQLVDRVREHLTGDLLLPHLLSLARQNEAGLQAVIDEEQRAQLKQAQCDAFAGRFRNLERPQQAQTLCRMIERSAVTIEEVACNLYRLTRMDDAEPLSVPA